MSDTPSQHDCSIASQFVRQQNIEVSFSYCFDHYARCRRFIFMFFFNLSNTELLAAIFIKYLILSTPTHLTQDKFNETTRLCIFKKKCTYYCTHNFHSFLFFMNFEIENATVS